MNMFFMVRLWDIRAGAKPKIGWQVDTEPTALAIHGSGQSVAISTESASAIDETPSITTWDLRKPGVGRKDYEEVHSDRVTHMKWHPENPQFLYTVSEDGLMCCIKGNASDPDEELEWCCNFETPIRKFSFFGPGAKYAAVLTANEGVQLCQLGEDVFQAFPNLRQKLIKSSNPSSFDYLIECGYDASIKRLGVLAGTNDGRLRMFDVTPKAVVPRFRSAPAAGSHCGVVRCALWTRKFIVTGGEDGRVCVWSSPASAQSLNIGGMSPQAKSGGKAGRSMPASRGRGLFP